MVKPNTIIAVGNEERKSDYNYAKGVCLQVFEIDEGSSINSIVNNINSEEEYLMLRKLKMQLMLLKS